LLRNHNEKKGYTDIYLHTQLADGYIYMATTNWTFYLLTNLDSNATYAGVTNNTKRRIRQHNGEISGGSRSCKRRGGRWVFALTVGSFEKREVLRFEYAFKRATAGVVPRGIRARLRRLYTLLASLDRTDLTVSFHNPDLERMYQSEAVRCIAPSSQIPIASINTDSYIVPS
jgi:predicted GIY-YIG superfamily endonuclease